MVEGDEFVCWVDGGIAEADNVRLGRGCHDVSFLEDALEGVATVVVIVVPDLDFGSPGWALAAGYQ